MKIKAPFKVQRKQGDSKFFLRFYALQGVRWVECGFFHKLFGYVWQ